VRFAHIAWIGCLLLVLAACSRREQQTPPAAMPLKVCSGTTYSLLLAIAQQKGFFAQEGLQVESRQFAIGREAMEAMLADACDVSSSADTPVADYGLARNDLRVIAGIARSDQLCYLVVRRDSGIRTLADLKGQRIGTPKGTAPHFFLDLLLSRNRLTEQDVRLQFMKGEELNAALRTGALAAIATTDLNALKLEEELGTGVNLISDPGIALNHGYLVLKEPTLKAKQEVLRRMLRALQRAEQFVDKNPTEARELFASYLQISSAIADKLLTHITLRLTLEPAMILTLEDHARWLREREGASAPHKSFKDIFRPELLQAVAPESVTLH